MQCNAISTAQYSTAQYSTVQYNTVQYNNLYLYSIKTMIKN